MKNFTATARAVIAATALLGSSFAAAQQATIPASFVGTYDLTYAYAQAGSPVPNGATTTMTITSEGVLCIAEFVLDNPIAAGAEAIWTSNEVGVKLAVSNITTGVFNEINVSSLSNVWYGQFSAQKVSNSTECGGAAQPDLTAAYNLFELAEQVYGDLLSDVVTGHQELDGYIYRYYPSSSIYLAINNGQIYVMGGQFGDTPLSVGAYDSVMAELNAAIGEIPEGDFRLTVSGTVQVMGVSTGFSNLVVENIPAPDASDLEEMEDAVRASLENVGTIHTAQVTNVQTSSDRIQFDVNVSVTSNGMSYTYNLHYDYVRM